MSGYGTSFGALPWGGFSLQGVDYSEYLSDTVTASDALFVGQGVGGYAVAIDSYTFQVFFSGMSRDGISDPSNYSITTLDGVNITIESVVPVSTELGSGDNGFFYVPKAQGGNGAIVYGGSTFTATGHNFTTEGVLSGDSLVVRGSTSIVYTVSSVGVTTLTIEGAFLTPTSGGLDFEVFTPVKGWVQQFYASGFGASNVGDYLTLPDVPDAIRISGVVDSNTVNLDANLTQEESLDGSIPWVHYGPVTSVIVTTTKMTRGATYRVRTRYLKDRFLNPLTLDSDFLSNAAKPQLNPLVTVLEDGVILADFGEPMRGDSALTDPSEYTLSGVTPTEVFRVTQIDPQRVALYTRGMGVGSYTLTVNATGTPKDIAGNPIDPTFNQAIFSGFSPLTQRSVYTDKGPIAKPSLTLQSTLQGLAGSIAAFSTPEITITGLSGIPLTGTGLTISITGAATAGNNGTFVITQVISATSVKYANPAGFFPDANSGAIDWTIQASINSFTDVTLPGAILTPDHVGLYVTLSGGIINGGTFRILAVIPATLAHPAPDRATLQASFTLPDASSGFLDWELVDPRNGQIADDPADVTVKITSAATGSITTVVGSLLVDGETFTLDDGINPPVVFEFDNNSIITPGNVPVVFTALDTADQVRNFIVFAVNGSTVGITASIGGSGLVDLVNDLPGLGGNVTITETVANAGFLVTGMSGGTLTIPVTPDAVIGLLGQIVLNTAPLPTDDVKVDYNWICNPEVEIRRLNSREFRLNSWNRDVGYPNDSSQHKYRYNNTLTKPGLYVRDDMQAFLDQPLLRDLKYRAYERAYTPVLNDPNLLVLNTPIHRIAYPPMQRQLAEAFVRYESFTLPENDPIVPWKRQGTGLASVSAGVLTVTDNSTGIFPTGQPVFWVRGVDLTFPHVFALAWRCEILTTGSILDGVFTGLAAGYSDELLSVIVGYLENSGTTASIVSVVSGVVTLTGLSDMAPGAVGQTLVISGASSALNNGSFVITEYVSGSSVKIANALGVSPDLNNGTLSWKGNRKLGFARRGATDDPSLMSSWVGSFDSLGNSTYQPVDFDWTVLHSYRVYRDPSGVVRLYIDGEVNEIAKILPQDLPFLEELNAPFDAIQDVFFGSVSRPAESISKWDFIRYLSVPINPQQTAPSLFTSYEANVLPELDTKPWTPVGYHGTETIIASDYLLLDSTSATDVDPSVVGLVGADFRGFVRFEPLLTAASEVVLDVGLDLRTHTFGVTPDGLMAAIDNGDRLMQLCFFPDKPTPKKSYGGRSLPENFSPYFWTPAGVASADMVGRVLRISDASLFDGRIYSINDNAPDLLSPDPNRVVAANTDYMLEFRVKVISYTVDGAGFAGVFAQVFDGTTDVGIMFREVAGTKYVAFTSDGTLYNQFAFNWGDGQEHTYRVRKTTVGDLVSLFVDNVFLGSRMYSAFTPLPIYSPTGTITFGSRFLGGGGFGTLSVVDWHYCNVWRVLDDQKHYIGLWNGGDRNNLTGYHLPLKASGQATSVSGNTLGDVEADFFVDGVAPGDRLVVDVGPNKGVYEVAAVATPTTLTIVGTWPAAPSEVAYRIANETDWTVQHKYRLLKNPTGDINVLIDSDPLPLITTDYSSVTLPASADGVVHTLTGGVAGIAFGSFEPTDLSQSSWDFVRYGITRSLTELRIVPPHQVLNQWNVMASPEHLRASTAHPHTSFKSSSTGIPPKIDPDFLNDPTLVAFTLLNEGTPLVPSTQTFEVRAPFATQVYVSALNQPEDVLNSDGDFTLNDGSIRYQLVVPDDVLYNSLDVIERQTGEISLLTPFCDDCGLLSFALEYTKEVCLTYDGVLLPENTVGPTPWELVSDDDAQVSTSAFAGILTYSTGVLGTRTVYRNNTPLPDAPGLQTEVTFRIKLLNDSTGGTGDSQVRFGLSAPGMTLGLAFVTTPLAERYVLAIDLNTNAIVGALTFDYLDGLSHEYKIVRDPAMGTVRIFIDA